MNLIQYQKPIYHIELALLLTKAIKINETSINTFTNAYLHSPEKDSRINKICPGYLDDYRILLEKSNNIIKNFPKIIDYNKMNNLGVFTKIMYQVDDLNFKNLDLNMFTQAAATAIVLNFSKDDTDNINEPLNIENTIRHIYNKQTINFSELFTYINKQDINELNKIKILEFYNNIKYIFKDMMSLFDALMPLYKYFYNKYSNFIKELYNKTSSYKLADLGIDQWVDLNSFNKDLIKNFYFTYSLINYEGVSVKISTLENQKSLILYGTFLDLFQEMKKEDYLTFDSIESQMNALGDSKRLKIFSLLLEREYYLKEIADTLKLSSSTISHHMDILSEAGLVKLKAKGKRIYYSINVKETQYMSEFFNKVSIKLEEKKYGY